MLHDKLLVWKLNRNSENALCQIYGKYKDDLLSIAAGLLKNKSDAQDIVHEVFMTLATNAKTFKLTGSLKAYLATCVANKARNLNRDNFRKGDVPIDNAPPMASKHRRPDHWLIHHEQSKLICDALAQLPYEQREVIMLRIHGDMKFKTIAKTQQTSVATVLSRYRYGIDKLRTILKDHEVTL